MHEYRPNKVIIFGKVKEFIDKENVIIAITYQYKNEPTDFIPVHVDEFMPYIINVGEDVEFKGQVIYKDGNMSLTGRLINHETIFKEKYDRIKENGWDYEE